MELVLIGVGLSMDAFAVALCKGLSMRRINYAHAAVIALFFGVFQAVMPLIGWVLGTQGRLDLKELLMLAVATSIDALAVGITFAFLQVSILPAVATIGLITFALSFAGVVVGNRFGTRFQKKAEIAGGVVLVLIGLKILLEHLGLL